MGYTGLHFAADLTIGSR